MPVARQRRFGYQSAVQLDGARILSLVLVAAILAVMGSVLFGDHGVTQLMRLRRERRELGSQTFRALETNAALRREIERLRNDDLYLEGLARRSRGLVRPNETVYRFRRPPGES